MIAVRLRLLLRRRRRRPVLVRYVVAVVVVAASFSSVGSCHYRLSIVNTCGDCGLLLLVLHRRFLIPVGGCR